MPLSSRVPASGCCMKGVVSWPVVLLIIEQRKYLFCFSYMGGGRLHQWHSRNNLHKGADLVPGSVWIRTQPRVW